MAPAKPINVLITCAGRRHYLVEYFREALQGRGRVIGADMDLTAPALAACDASHLVPSVFDSDYLERLVQVIKAERISLVFSVNDFELGLLADNRDDLERATGAMFVVPPSGTARIAADKWLTFVRCNELGIKTPATFLRPEQALEAASTGRVSFPFVVKPRWGSGSIGILIAQNDRELRTRFAECDEVISRSGVGKLGSENRVIIQQMIRGQEYAVDILYGLDGRRIGFTAKRKMVMRSGETDKAVSVEPAPFAPLVERITESLPHRGNMDCDFIGCGGELYLLELNPRFGGAYPFTHMAGANHVRMLLDDFEGKPLADYRYSIGRAFAKCDRIVEVTSFE